ncbi:motility protein B [Clostridium pasteurianum DSM 525 = ATCC 6013]|uniref:Motility protein B n=1 Tax=Clostridium pasteurianum DSM 525 = ATCC 6013 TaxID=1262449 RepID=A0A0H3J5L4_CLOPA|nr:flagellar motor protein MotB [Clostridium pasteurianum]AJA46225.1 motility protein B [Clostridium pasteurianum DSM 525 = ATCC 6013]AJA50213.1 motility protein B [Clostridium pasteurianum DSM 525 = ATCC 6013]AOZ73681.1 chemotaxis protein MotB [Clostridium pasteurianum DSM 525 = ATCC 6013]AOZ77478.1 chemotaxis protein MotB [Clostridium pasteurianum]ELP60810.1 Chemotaxis motility protein B [Clostridium pasteurianum DSM 525 = ATCC 6013]
MRKKKPQEHVNTERYMLTYSDMITLLMMFFIVMYASSNVDAVKYKQISDSFKIAFSGGHTIVGSGDSMDARKNKQTTKQDNVNEKVNEVQDEANELQKVKQTIDNYIKQNNMTGNVSTEIEERGLIVSVKDTLFFDSGKADVKPEFQKKIIEIGNILNSIDNYIRIEGHTDNVPISNYRYMDNLDLSTARANAVLRILQNQAHVNAKRLTSMGYGEQRPVSDNNTEAGRAKNRRVDIVVIDSKYNATEDNSKK